MREHREVGGSTGQYQPLDAARSNGRGGQPGHSVVSALSVKMARCTLAAVGSTEGGEPTPRRGRRRPLGRPRRSERQVIRTAASWPPDRDGSNTLIMPAAYAPRHPVAARTGTRSLDNAGPRRPRLLDRSVHEFPAPQNPAIEHRRSRAGDPGRPNASPVMLWTLRTARLSCPGGTALDGGAGRGDDAAWIDHGYRASTAMLAANLGYSRRDCWRSKDPRRPAIDGEQLGSYNTRVRLNDYAHTQTPRTDG